MSPTLKEHTARHCKRCSNCAWFCLIQHILIPTIQFSKFPIPISKLNGSIILLNTVYIGYWTFHFSNRFLLWSTSFRRDIKYFITFSLVSNEVTLKQKGTGQSFFGILNVGAENQAIIKYYRIFKAIGVKELHVVQCYPIKIHEWNQSESYY